VKVLGWMKVAASWRAYRETLGSTVEVRVLEEVLKLPKVFITPGASEENIILKGITRPQLMLFET